MKNISLNFLNLSQKKKEKLMNTLVPSICSEYCCRKNCNGCFIQELTEETFEH